MCKLKGETPQDGINRQQGGDRAWHGGQMDNETTTLGSERVFAAAASGRGWSGLESLIRECQRGPHGSLLG